MQSRLLIFTTNQEEKYHHLHVLIRIAIAFDIHFIVTIIDDDIVTTPVYMRIPRVREMSDEYGNTCLLVLPKHSILNQWVRRGELLL